MNLNDISQPIFGNWYIDEEIGSGAFGTVYKIKREDFGNTYYSALKVIHIPFDESEIGTLRSEGMDDKSITTYYKDLVQNLINEINILNSLKGNSNIVSYEDHQIEANEDETQYTIYIRMELLTPLKEYLSKNEMSDEDIVRLGTDLCNALSLCEKLKIIHRDIKPDNIFVSSNGDFKLGDFGVARTVEKTMSQMSKKGTYTYMAPEVYLGRPYDNRADIYSLGLILYQMLNHNRAPFLPLPPNPIKFSDRETALVKRMNGEAIPLPDTKNEALAKVVVRACCFDANNRYANAQELINELNKSMIKENKIMTEQDYDKTVSPFGEPITTPPSNDIQEEIDYEKTVSPFGEPIGDVRSETSATGIVNMAQQELPKNKILDSFKLFFKNYTNFGGRSRRSDYWNVVLVNVIINVIATVLASVIGSVAGYILGIYGLAILIPSIALMVRRLHDIGKKGTFALLVLIPLVGAIILIVWFTQDSQPGTNEYGENPKYR